MRPSYLELAATKDIPASVKNFLPPLAALPWPALSMNSMRLLSQGLPPSSLGELRAHPICSSSSLSSTSTLTDNSDFQSPLFEWSDNVASPVPDFASAPVMPYEYTVPAPSFLQHNALLPNMGVDVQLNGLTIDVALQNMLQAVPFNTGLSGLCVNASYHEDAGVPSLPYYDDSPAAKADPCLFGKRLDRRGGVFVPSDLSIAAIQSFQAEAAKAASKSTGRIDVRSRSKLHRRAPLSRVDANKSSSRSYSEHVNTILYEWLREHEDDPYASPQEKKRLMGETGLSKMQLKNWFCNVRRRKLPHTIKRPKMPVSVPKRGSVRRHLAR